MSREGAAQFASKKSQQSGSKRRPETSLERDRSKKHRGVPNVAREIELDETKSASDDDDDGEKQDTAMKSRKPGQVRTPPPDQVAGISAKTHLVPPDAENIGLRKEWEIDAIAITKNSTIKNAVVRTMATLMPAKNSPEKKMLVALMARNESANHCISVAEIVKREIKRKDKSWFQYTGSWSRLETLPTTRPAQIMTEVEGEADEEHFQTLQRTDRERVRNVPCLVIYLSLERVPILQGLYSEQKSKI